MMEAKDTVVHADGCATNLGVIGAMCNCGAEAQAEISFKAGERQGYDKGVKDRLGLEDTLIQRLKTEKEAGIRKAVEFIESYLVTTVHPEGDMHHIDDKEWQSVKQRLLEARCKK